MLAGFRGVAGHPHGQQGGQLLKIVAQAVAAVFGNKGIAGKARAKLAGVVAPGGVKVGGEHRHQLAQPLQALLASGELVNQPQAGAVAARALADALQGVFALRHHHHQLRLGVGQAGGVLLAIAARPGQRLGRQRGKARDVPFQIRGGAHQFAVHAQPADAVRQQQHSVQQLGVNAAPIHLGRRARPGQDGPKAVGQLGRHSF